MTDLPIPAELAYPDGEEPFTLAELDAALAYLAAHDPECEDPSLLLLDLGPDEANIDLGPLPDDQREGAAAVARAAGWHITDRGGAEWAARRYAERRADLTDVQTRAKAWKAQIAEWERKEVAKLQGSAFHLELLLVEYAAGRRAADPKGAKSTPLPSATIKGTAQNVGGKVAVADEDAVVDWASTSLDSDEYEEVVHTTTKVMLDPLRKRLRIALPEADPDAPADAPPPEAIVVDEGGQPVPGVTIEPEYVSWKVNPT